MVVSQYLHEAAFLFALPEAINDGLDYTNSNMIRLSEFQESYTDFIQIEDNRVREKLIDYIDFLDQYELTSKGKGMAGMCCIGRIFLSAKVLHL